MKYSALTTHLQSLDGDLWEAEFSDVKQVLGFDLPPSAYKYTAWWANQYSDNCPAQSSSWTSAGWHVTSLDLTLRRVTFVRKSGSRPVRDEPQNNAPAIYETRVIAMHDWDVTPELHFELRLQWAHLGAIQLLNGRLHFPANAPDAPGLYRIRIRSHAGFESRYIGETSSLKARFAQYRNPGDTQATNIRFNEFLLNTLEQRAQIALSIVTQTAWIRANHEQVPADFQNKAIRRLFANFAQVAEHDSAVENLNK